MTTAERERLLGIILLVAAAVCLLLAILIGWGAISRWRAISAANLWQTARLTGNSNDMTEAAQAAAAYGSSEAALGLPAVDLKVADTGRLDRLRRDVPARQRPLIDATLAFHGVLHGGNGQGLDGDNGRILAHIAALKKGTSIPPFPTLERGSEFYAAILDHALQTHIQVAWNAGDQDKLREALAPFVLLRPDHADRAKARTILAGLTGTSMGGYLSADDNRVALLRQLAMLAPDHADAMFALIPEKSRSAAEIQRLLLAGGAQSELKPMVERALANPSEAVLVVLFRRCLAENNRELAQRLVDQAPPSIKPGMELALAFASGDVATMVRLQPHRQDLRPQVTPPVGRENLISCHLTTAAGLNPSSAGLTVRLNEEPVAPDRIKRRGSLLEIQFRGGGTVVNLEIKLGDVVVFGGPVQL